MPAKVIDVAQACDAGDLRDVVHRAVQALAEGHLVVFPTETVYGVAASALNEQAIAKLAQLKGRQVGHPFTLAVKSLDDASDYIPDMPVLGERLGRRCWPGPLTMVLDAAHSDSLAHRLPAATREAVCPAGTLGLRVPASLLIIEVLRLLTGPLALTSANPPGQAEPVTADEVVAQTPHGIDLVLDDGRCKFGQSSTVVLVRDGKLKILRPGVISTANLRRLASLFVLLVCTGNTCRSPMAEAIARRLIARRLGCNDAEVEDRGVIVTSAGIAAMNGGHASPEAVDVMAAQGMSLGDHLSQPLREPLVQNADFIFTMTRTHRDAILAQWPHVAPRTHVLGCDGQDVSDPIGGTPQMYQQCAQQIESLLQARIDALDLSEVQIDEG